MSRSSLSKTIHFLNPNEWDEMLEDARQQPAKKKKEHSKDAKVLRTRTWLKSLLSGHGLTKRAIYRTINENDEATGTVNSWLSGKHSAYPGKVAQVEKHYPGSNYFYYFPLFELLMDTHISRNQLSKIVSPYVIEEKEPLNCLMWDFPRNQNNLDSGQLVISRGGLPGETMLLDRFDIYGLMGLVYLLRLAEVQNDTAVHLEYAKHTLRVLPGACRHPFLKPHWPQLFHVLYGIIGRMPSTWKIIQPRRLVIQSQIAISRAEFFRRPSYHRPSRSEWYEMPYEPRRHQQEKW